MYLEEERKARDIVRRWVSTAARRRGRGKDTTGRHALCVERRLRPDRGVRLRCWDVDKWGNDAARLWVLLPKRRVVGVRVVLLDKRRDRLRVVRRTPLPDVGVSEAVDLSQKLWRDPCDATLGMLHAHARIERRKRGHWRDKVDIRRNVRGELVRRRRPHHRRPRRRVMEATEVCVLEKSLGASA